MINIHKSKSQNPSKKGTSTFLYLSLLIFTCRPTRVIKLSNWPFVFLLAYSIFGNIINCKAQNRKIDSLKKVLVTCKEDTNKVNDLYTLSREFIFTGLYDSSASFASAALTLASSIEEGSKQIVLKQTAQKEIVLALTNLGNANYLLGNYPKSLNYYFTGLSVCDRFSQSAGAEVKPQFSVLKSKLLGNIGIAYHQQSNYTESLRYFLKALKISEELRIKSGVAANLGNIGSIYFEQKDYLDALDYYSKALKIARELGNKNYVIGILGNIGAVYKEFGTQAKALGDEKKSDSLLNMTLNYDFEALKMAEESEDKNRMAIQLVNIGVAYNEKGTYPKAFDYFFRALKIEKDLGDKNSMAATLGTLGLLYSETKQFSEAEKYLTDAQKLNKEIGALKQQMDVENYLSGLYTQTKRFNLALDHYKKYIAVRDSITNDENIKKQTRLEMQFDFDKKTTTDSIRNAAQVRQERLKHDQEIKQQKIYAYGGAVGFLLMIIVAGVSFRAYRQKQKANEMISHQKSLVEEKQKEILDSIHYAQRIQRSLLPSEKYIARNLNRLKK